MGTMIDTPEGIAAFRQLQQYYALKLEVNCPGLRHSRGSVMKLIISENPSITKRTKKGVLEEYGNLLREKGVLKSDSNG